MNIGQITIPKALPKIATPVTKRLFVSNIWGIANFARGLAKNLSDIGVISRSEAVRANTEILRALKLYDPKTGREEWVQAWSWKDIKEFLKGVADGIF